MQGQDNHTKIPVGCIGMNLVSTIFPVALFWDMKRKSCTTIVDITWSEQGKSNNKEAWYVWKVFMTKKPPYCSYKQ
jgi:hypothetical protein